MSRPYHLRLGLIRIMRYPNIDLRASVMRMAGGFGYQFNYGHTSLQIAAHWWGFGKDG